MARPNPIPPEVWSYVRLLIDQLREQHGERLTYRQIGDAFSISESRVKQLLGGWVQTKQPDGSWRIAPPKKETDFVDPGPSDGERRYDR